MPRPYILKSGLGVIRWGYVPVPLPFQRVKVVNGTQRDARKCFRFIHGNHLSRKHYWFDNLDGQVWEEKRECHFITDDRETNRFIVRLCQRLGYRQKVMWEGSATNLYHVILPVVRLEHKLLKALRAQGFKITGRGPMIHLVRKP